MDDALNNQQIHEYIKNPNVCPFCGKDTVGYGGQDDYEFVDNGGAQNYLLLMVCVHCDWSWWNVYSLSNVIGFTPPEPKPIPQPTSWDGG